MIILVIIYLAQLESQSIASLAATLCGEAVQPGHSIITPPSQPSKSFKIGIYWVH